jgi:hypothetical protein
VKQQTSAGLRAKHFKYLPAPSPNKAWPCFPTSCGARAVQVNIAIMRSFVHLREMLLSNAELARKLCALEKKYDAQFKVVFDAIRELMTPPEPPNRRIGFHP